jgi:SAM-dependent methyltransferase
METAPNLRADAFSGTAQAYLRFRPPYPAILLNALLAQASLSSRAVLLDLACGPGRVALALAVKFDRVCAVDLEPEMVAVGMAEAKRRGIKNVTWLIGPAERADIPTGSVDLITIGEAFHRLDQPAVIANALRWLKPGRCIVTLGTEGLLIGGAGWKDTVATIARRWTARAFPGGWAQSRSGAAATPEAIADALERAGFVDVENRCFSEPWEWSLEEVVGYLRSTSVCSKHVLRQRLADFEAELRAALGSDGPFREQLKSSYTLARKPK